jgi:hypothetical protein
LPEDQQTQENLSTLIEAFMHLYGFEEPDVKSLVVPEESKAVLDAFDKELPNLLLLFSVYYEQTA